MFTKRTIRFQSTLPREERPTTHAASMSSNVYFNPRSHERSDSDTTAIKQIWSNFNPRSHERSDAHSQRVSVTRSKFQSTLPREERQLPMLPLVAFFYFNPRSHERSDKSPVGAMFVGNNISIHAPTRGATGTPVTGVKGAKISIHAPTRGATALSFVLFRRHFISIHAPTRGATRKTSKTALIYQFQSTLPREERPEPGAAMQTI